MRNATNRSLIMNTLTSSVPNSQDLQVFRLGNRASISSTSSSIVGIGGEGWLAGIGNASAIALKTASSIASSIVLGCALSLIVVFLPGYKSLIQPASHIRAPIEAATAAVILNSGVEWGYHPIGIAALQGHVTASIATFEGGLGHGVASSIIGSVWFARWELNPLQPTYKVGTVTGPSLANRVSGKTMREEEVTNLPPLAIARALTEVVIPRYSLTSRALYHGYRYVSRAGIAHV